MLQLHKGITDDSLIRSLILPLLKGIQNPIANAFQSFLHNNVSAMIIAKMDFGIYLRQGNEMVAIMTVLSKK